MSEVSKQSAIARYNIVVQSGDVSKIAVAPGYGITYTQAGVARSARIPEIESGDTDYITTFQGLINSAAVASPLPPNKASVSNDEVGLKQGYGLGTIADDIKTAAVKTAEIIDIINQPVGKGSTYPPQPNGGVTSPEEKAAKENKLIMIGLGVLAASAAVWFFFFRKKR